MTIHVKKKTIFFYVRLISPINCWHVSRLSEFFRTMAAKTLKNPYCLQTVTCFSDGISRSWERKSITKRFATGRFWPYTWENSSVGKDQFNNWEFWKLGPLFFFCSDSMHVFILSAPSHFTIFIRNVNFFIFIHWLISGLLLSVKGDCVYVINKVKHGCL